jgi:hypothetical protein
MYIQDMIRLFDETFDLILIKHERIIQKIFLGFNSLVEDHHIRSMLIKSFNYFFFFLDIIFP